MSSCFRFFILMFVRVVLVLDLFGVILLINVRIFF